MIGEYYILKDKKPVVVDVLTWAKWIGYPGNKIVAQEMVGGGKVSTVFLGIDHAFFGQSPPILFETMVFGGPCDGEQERCCTWEEAVEMHNKWVEKVREHQ